jgi:lipopolysaccharide transport system ATP-binding protein
MNNVAVNVQNVSKLYRIGRDQERNDTLRDALTNAFPRLARSRDTAVKYSAQRPQHTDELWALNNVTFQVGRGEVVGIIGRNGAGKSTLLKILSRITEPARGRVTLRGRVASLLEVGTGFHPELTGRENIYLNGAILGMRRREIVRKFEEIVAFAEIERFLDTPVKRYSSGMYVRLAFAVAAHLEPEILLVDEVLAVGDAAFQKKCLGKMGNVAKEGRTVLFVSHNMVAVQTLCQRAIWLEGGHLKGQGPIDQIVSAYMRSGLEEASIGERVWGNVDDAPGNESVRLRRIGIKPVSEEDGHVISMQTPIEIEVEYWNLLPGVYLHATLHIYNEQGIIAFTTGAAGAVPDENLHVQPAAGLFRSICRVPGNLLNSGFHRVSIFMVRGSLSGTFILHDAIGFEVVDTAQRGFAWFGKEPGVLCPELPWSTEYLGNSIQAIG